MTNVTFLQNVLGTLALGPNVTVVLQKTNSPFTTLLQIQSKYVLACIESKEIKTQIGSNIANELNMNLLKIIDNFPVDVGSSFPL